jgi:hypothetical protein
MQNQSRVNYGNSMRADSLSAAEAKNCAQFAASIAGLAHREGQVIGSRR